MASPEIDEAAAVEYAEDLQRWMHGYWGAKANLARAALAWKARAEELERAIVHDDAVAGAFLAAIRGEEVSDFMASFGEVREAMDLRARAEAAEAERDSLKRQLDQSVKAR